jgi:hypothetical protein
MSDDAKKPTKISFHYLKSAGFRSVHCDGIIGGVTPSGKIHFAAYTERGTIPQLVVHEIGPDGKLGSEVERVGRTGIAREMEVDIVMDVGMAERMRAWLDSQITEAKALSSEARKLGAK